MLFVLLLFGIFAMAALVIDLGFARLAQRQMQTAADAAALEGLRGEGDPSMSYEVRQDAAEQLIAWTFDDDLDASNGDDGIAGDGGQFGAGPLVQFADGVGDPTLFASQFMTVAPDNTVYKPEVQRSASNLESNRFRVAIQRGDGIEGNFDVFAQGPYVPYLFARGSLMPRDLIGEGISVGATAIAGAAPVVCVGSGQVQSGFTSLGAAFAKDKWMMNDLRQAYAFDGNIIGDRVSLDSSTNPSGQGFVGIYDENLKRVIAFGLVRTGEGVIEKFQVGLDNAMPIAATNASPAFLFSLLTRGADVELSPSERSNTIGLVLSARKLFLDELRLMGPNVVAQQILHAPALVR